MHSVPERYTQQLHGSFHNLGGRGEDQTHFLSEFKLSSLLSLPHSVLFSTSLLLYSFPFSLFQLLLLPLSTGTTGNINASIQIEESRSSKAIFFRKPSLVVVLMSFHPHWWEGVSGYMVHSRKRVSCRKEMLAGSYCWTSPPTAVHRQIFGESTHAGLPSTEFTQFRVTVHVCLCMDEFVYEYIYVRVYVCMHICMCVCKGRYVSVCG